MKIYFYIGFLLLTSSCAIQGEVFRLQTRINHWYQLLNDDQELLFAQNNYITLGKQLDQLEQTDSSFSNSLRDLRINEAIMSFDGTQTTHFFYNILLRDLAKFSYEEFMLSLSSNEKISFFNTTNFTSTHSFEKQKNILAQAQKQYGFKNFTEEQILNYYRHVSMPHNYYPVIYEILAFLARYRGMEVFLQSRNASSIEGIFDTINQMSKSKRIPIRTQGERDLATWNDLKQRTYLTNLSDQDFLALVLTILPELDSDVRTQTIQNIKDRFKEE